MGPSQGDLFIVGGETSKSQGGPHSEMEWSSPDFLDTFRA